MADIGREKRGTTQEVSADFDRETEAFDFYRMVRVGEMTVDDVKETILSTKTQRDYLLETAKPKELGRLKKLFEAREDTWKQFLSFHYNPELVKRFEKKWMQHRSQGAKRVDLGG